MVNTRKEEAPLTVMAPPPEIDRSVLMSGKADVNVIVPATLKPMTSDPEPAAHSPAAAPEAVSVLAAVIASRSVQAPSFAATSAKELTVIDAARACETASELRSPRPRTRAPRRRIIGGHMGVSSSCRPILGVCRGRRQPRDASARCRERSRSLAHSRSVGSDSRAGADSPKHNQNDQAEKSEQNHHDSNHRLRT